MSVKDDIQQLNDAYVKSVLNPSKRLETERLLGSKYTALQQKAKNKQRAKITKSIKQGKTQIGGYVNSVKGVANTVKAINPDITSVIANRVKRELRKPVNSLIEDVVDTALTAVPVVGKALSAVVKAGQTAKRVANTAVNVVADPTEAVSLLSDTVKSTVNDVKSTVSEVKQQPELSPLKQMTTDMIMQSNEFMGYTRKRRDKLSDAEIDLRNSARKHYENRRRQMHDRKRMKTGTWQDYRKVVSMLTKDLEIHTKYLKKIMDALNSAENINTGKSPEQNKFDLARWLLDYDLLIVGAFNFDSEGEGVSKSLIEVLEAIKEGLSVMGASRNQLREYDITADITELRSVK